MFLPLPLSWWGTSSWMDYQTSSTWSSFLSHPLRHVHLIKHLSVLHLIFPTHGHICPFNSIIPQAKLLRTGMFSLMCGSKPLSLRVTWPLPFQTMPYLLRRDPPGRASGSFTEIDINFCLSNILLPQHSNFCICSHKPVIPKGTCSI